MTYDDIAAHFLVPKGTEKVPSAVPSSPARRLRDSIEAIATIGWWSRAAAEGSTSLGHGFFDGYAWGRAASLGESVAPSVVVSAFGVFSPALLIPTYEHGRTVSSRAQILTARATGAAQGLKAATPNVPLSDIESVGTTLLAAVQRIEAGPRFLFGALQALDAPDDPYGRLWRAAELVREHRGDTHLAAMATAGLSMCEMNVFTEVWLEYPVGEYSTSRGFTPEEIHAAAARLESRGWMVSGELTDQGREVRDQLEDLTDCGEQQLVSALGADLEPVIRAAHAISDAVVASKQAPADPRKRAAG